MKKAGFADGEDFQSAFASIYTLIVPVELLMTATKPLRDWVILLDTGLIVSDRHGRGRVQFGEE
jgi:hypothetical protein